MTFLDRIKETSTSTGTNTFTLSGAVVGYKTFSNGTYKYCIVNATETEWEVGEGTVTSGVLTRTTIEASSNAGSAVNFSAGTKYVFNTVSAAYVNSLVPYNGATASVNLGAYGITSDYLQLSTTPTATGAVARMLWNDTDGTYDIGLKGGNVTLQVGQEEVVRVVNKTGATLTEAAYQAVYISGAQGQRPKVALAQGNTDATSASTIGLVTETIANNAEGFITTSGVVRNINTTGSLQGETWADGDLIYLSPAVAGGITNVKPIAPNHTVYLGYVIHAHATQGKIFVKVDNGYELTELHDIYAPSPTNKQSIYWNSTNSRYELNTIAGILGYTPQAAITLTTTGTSGAATLVGNTLNIPQYSGGGISGSGTAGQVTYWSGTSAVTGNANFVYQSGTGNLQLGTSTTSGYRLDVNGTGATTGALRVTGGNVQFGSSTGLNWDNTNNRLNHGSSIPTNIGNINIVQSNNGIVGFSVKNTSSGTSAQCGFYVENNNGYVAQMYKMGSATTSYKTISANDLGFYNGLSAGNISILNDFASGNINFTAGGASTAHLTIKSNGRINMSALPTSATGLSTGDLWNNLGVINIV